MIIVLSGPQHSYKKVQGALESAGCKIIRDPQTGDAIPDNHGHSDNHETRWTGETFTAAEIEELSADNPDHGLKVGDIRRHTGEFVALPQTAPTCFLTVEGSDPNTALVAVESFGWRVRSHADVKYEETSKPQTAEEKLARLGLTPAELKSLIGA